MSGYGLKNLRFNLHCSQSEMSEFLNTTRSQIALVEVGQRLLPIPQATSLGKLSNGVQDSLNTKWKSAEVDAWFEEEKNAAHDKLKARLIILEKRLAKAEKELATMKQEYIAIRIAMDHHTYILEHQPKLKAPEKLWLEYRISVEKKNLAKNGVDAQNEMHLYICGVQEEMRRISGLLESQG